MMRTVCAKVIFIFSVFGFMRCAVMQFPEKPPTEKPQNRTTAKPQKNNPKSSALLCFGRFLHKKLKDFHPCFL